MLFHIHVIKYSHNTDRWDSMYFTAEASDPTAANELLSVYLRSNFSHPAPIYPLSEFSSVIKELPHTSLFVGVPVSQPNHHLKILTLEEQFDKLIDGELTNGGLMGMTDEEYRSAVFGADGRKLIVTLSYYDEK